MRRITFCGVPTLRNSIASSRSRPAARQRHLFPSGISIWIESFRFNMNGSSPKTTRFSLPIGCCKFLDRVSSYLGRLSGHGVRTSECEPSASATAPTPWPLQARVDPLKQRAKRLWKAPQLWKSAKDADLPTNCLESAKRFPHFPQSSGGSTHKRAKSKQLMRTDHLLIKADIFIC